MEREQNVLIVDDDRHLGDSMGRAFRRSGCRVIVCTRGDEALLRVDQECFDIIVTDFQMPLMDGSQLSHLVKERSPSTPVVMITGGFDDARLEKLKGRNIDAVLLKPFKLKEIQETVRSLLSSGS